MAEWCQGFLFGLQGERGLSERPEQEQVMEAVDDILQCSQLQIPELDEDDPEHLADLLELLEHVRICALLVHQAWNPPHPEAVSCH